MLKGKLYMVGVFGLIGLAMSIYGLLAISHASTEGYVSFVAPVMVVLVSAIIISKQVDDIRDDNAVVKEKLETVEKQTNGQLAAQFADLKSHVTEAVSNGDTGI